MSPKLIQVKWFTKEEPLNEWLRSEQGQSTFKVETVVVQQHLVYIAQYYIDNPEWYAGDLPF